MSNEELAAAHELADAAGLTVSDIMRLLLREAYLRKGGRIPTRSEVKQVRKPAAKRGAGR